MKSKIMRAVFGIALSAGAVLSPTVASADYNPMPSGSGYYFFNDGNGNCGIVACGSYGCAVIDRFPCPNEVSGN